MNNSKHNVVLLLLCAVYLAPLNLFANDFNKNSVLLHTGDFNNDSKIDLLYQGKNYTESHGIILGDGSGEFHNGLQFWSNGYLGINWDSSSHLLKVSDFNADFHADVFLQAASDGGSNYIVTSNTSGNVGELTSLTTSWGNSQLGLNWQKTKTNIILGDFDGNGQNELLLQGKSGSDTHATVLVDANGPSGILQQWDTAYLGLEWSGQTHVIHSGDFNGDGRSDLFLQAKWQFVLIDMDGLSIPVPMGKAYQHTILVADGNGKFTSSSIYDSWNNDYLGLGDAWMADNSNVIVGDFNGDGRDDIILQGRQSNSTHYLLHAGFLPTVYGAFGFEYQSWQNGHLGKNWSADSTNLIVGDFDGDGRADIFQQVVAGENATILADSNGQFTATSQQVNKATSPNLIGALPGKFSVNSGAANYDIPIEIPPGVNGVQPGLAITYNSQAGNGLVGVGWSLQGLSAISRCPKTFAQDNETNGITFTAADKFCLDGQRLMLVSGVYGGVDSEYRTEMESYSKIFARGSKGSGPAWFEVHTKSGQVLHYGNSDDSFFNLFNPITSSPRAEALTWSLNRVSDSVGNYMTLTYTKDVNHEYQLIDRIDYTSNDVAQLASNMYVKFLYNSGNRPDTEFGYLLGSKSVLSKRLEKIQTYVAGKILAEYQLTYQLSPNNNKSRLEKVTRCANVQGVNSCLYPTKIIWEDGTFGIKTARFNTGITNVGWNNKPMVLDVNGDGLSDLVLAYSGTWHIRFSTGNGFGPGVDTGLSAGSYLYTKPIDYNGDGKMDLLYPEGTVWMVLQSTGENFIKINTNVSNSGYDNYPQVIDVNGDGLQDVVTAPSVNIWHIRLNTPDGFSTANISTGVGAYNRHLSHPIDYNGDGKMDILMPKKTANEWFVVQSTGDSFELIATGVDTAFNNPDRNPQVADFNGDGLMDLATSYDETDIELAGTWRVRFNEGGKFGSAIDTGFKVVSLLNRIYSFAQTIDYNNDGKADIIAPAVSGGNNNFEVIHYDGNNFVKTDTGIPKIGYDYYFSSGDFDGDALSDLIIAHSSVWNLHFHEGIKGDLVSDITDAYGKHISIDYTPLTDSSIYTKNNDAQFPVVDIQPAMYVVSSYGRSDGVGGMYNHTFAYEGAKAHAQGRGFLGYARQVTYDTQNTLTKDTTYNQDFPFAGTINSSEIRFPNGDIISSTANSWVDIFATQQANPDYTGRYSVQLKSSEEKTFKLSQPIQPAPAITHVTTTQLYDLYGNVTNMVVDHNDGYKKTNTNTYYDPTAVNGYTDRLYTSEVIHEAPGGLTSTRKSSFEYHPTTGLLTKEIIEPGDINLELTTRYEYDVYGHKTKVTVDDNPLAQYPIGTRTSETIYDYVSYYTDPNNPRIKVTTSNALFHSETKLIDARWGKVTSLTGPNGLTTSWQYDSLGRNVREDRADGTWNTVAYDVCNYNCPSFGLSQLQITKASSAGGSSTTYFNLFGKELRTASTGYAGSVFRDTEYYANGTVYQTSLPYYAGDEISWHKYYYDALQRTNYETFPDHTTLVPSETNVTFDGLITTYTNAKGQVMVKEKNSQGKLFKTTNKLTTIDNVYITDTNVTNTYEYDAFGNLVKVTDDAGNFTKMTYDNRGRKITMNDPDMGQWQYRYDALGKLRWQQDAKGQVSTLDYDVLGRMTQRTDADGTSTWEYDTAVNQFSTPNAIGKLASVTGPGGYSKTHQYDDLTRPISTTTVIGTESFTVQTGYDAQSRVETTTYPVSPNNPTGFSIRNLYDSNGFLVRVENASNASQYFWKTDYIDANGRATDHHMGNGLKTVQIFNSKTGRIESIQTGTTSEVQYLNFEFDALGNLTYRQDMADSNSVKEETFTYDELNRVTSATVTGLAAKSYAYDSIGNIREKSDVGNYSYGELGAGPHAVTTAGGNTYTYDANGNQTVSSDGREIDYTSFNKPLQIRNNGFIVDYSYGTERQRIKKVSTKDTQTTTTYYLGKMFEKVVKPTGIVEYKHYLSTGAATVVYTSKSDATEETLYMYKDHLGSIDAITNHSGVVDERNSFDPFGARRIQATWEDALAASPIASITTRGFTGHEMDDDIGLINMNARMYDAKLGRFLQADTYVQFPESTQAYNRYTYVNNNPMSYTDPTGHFLSGLRNFISKYKKVIVAVGIAALTAGAAFAAMGVAVGTAGYGAIAIAGAASGFTSAMVLGGGHKALLKGAAFGAASAVTAAYIGYGMTDIFSEFGIMEEIVKDISHGIAQGALSEVQGGEFKSGFWGAAVGHMVGGFTKGWFPGDSVGHVVGRTVMAAVAGGAAAEAAGGKFGNGAVSAAFAHLFNSELTAFRTSTKVKGNPVLDKNDDPLVIYKKKHGEWMSIDEVELGGAVDDIVKLLKIRNATPFPVRDIEVRTVSVFEIRYYEEISIPKIVEYDPSSVLTTARTYGYIRGEAVATGGIISEPTFIESYREARAIYYFGTHGSPARLP